MTRFRLAELDEAAPVHDRDPIAEVAGRREVVGDVEDGQPELARLLLEEIEDAGPDGDVEHRYGLVGDEELRFEHQRAGDGQALALAAAQLVRILVREGPRRAQPGPFQRTGDSLPAFGGIAEALGGERLRHRVVDGESRIDRPVGVLKDHLDVPVVLAERASPERRKVAAVLEKDAAAVVALEPHQQAPQRGLAAAALADEAEDLALPDLEAHVVHRVHHGSLAAGEEAGELAARREGLSHVARGDERRRAQCVAVHVSLSAARARMSSACATWWQAA